MRPDRRDVVQCGVVLLLYAQDVGGRKWGISERLNQTVALCPQHALTSYDERGRPLVRGERRLRSGRRATRERSRQMKHTTKFVGLDVSKATVSVAVADQGPARWVGEMPNTPEAVRKLVAKLGGPEGLVVCYEAGPTGYGLQRQLEGLGVTCCVVAPSLTPVRPGDRVKTDRRDAVRLAAMLRAGELTPVWVPDAALEALRDLVRAREAAVEA